MNETNIENQINQEVVMEEVPKKKNFGFLLLFILFLFAGSIYLFRDQIPSNLIPFNLVPFNKPASIIEDESLKSFADQEDFLSYIEAGQNIDFGGSFGIGRTLEAMPMMAMEDNSVSMTASGDSISKSASAQRVSETNIQVLGVDEPDIVKTDGKNIFTSINSPIFRKAMPEPILLEENERSAGMILPREMEYKTSIIEAFPPKDMEEISEIDTQGNLLLSKDILMIIGSDEITSYDVSSADDPKEIWDISINDNTQIHSSRLIGEDLYVITQTYVDYEQPCPISPLAPVGGLTIPCDRIYHPLSPANTDVTYSAMKISTNSGEVENSISFVGSSQQSVVYVSSNAIYITYTTYGDYSEYMYEFFNSLGDDLVSSEVKSKLRKLSTYELSSQAKLIEIQSILEGYYKGISKDERRRIENEISNRMDDYATSKMREMEKTGIVKISTDDMEIKSNGVVAGHPLNQFSIDEHKDHLRIAVTVGGRSLQGSESANDVYVLDKDLKVVGSILDLGLDERIYSARFVGDMGYVVTFRETDPFYVLDLSNPNSPVMAGELKIPGFSSYLHPISERIILGVGREDNKVKLSMFDVSSPTNPKEIDKYMLDSYWTDVSNNHHAFLQDDKHKIFFLPAGADGNVFSYESNQMTLKKVVSDINAKRALFLDDYLYIVGDSEIVVLDESNWEEVNSLKL